MNRNILIVDDERDLCLLLKDFLVSKNYLVEIRHTIRDAAARIKSAIPDIVFLDNDLPDGLGWNFAAEMLKESPGIFVVFISALSGTIPQLPTGSRFTVIEKPIEINKLEAQLPQSV